MISFRKADLLDQFKDRPNEATVIGCKMIVAFQKTRPDTWELLTIDFADANDHVTAAPWTIVAEDKFIYLLTHECGFISENDDLYKIDANNVLKLPLQRDHNVNNWSDRYGTFQTDTFNMRLFFRDYID